MHSFALVVLTKKFVALSTLTLGVIALVVDPMIFAAAAAFVIGSIATAAVTIINALGVVKKELLAKQADLLAKTEVIQAHVDGMTTAAAAKRTADEDTIAGLRAQLAERDRTAALLAQAAVTVATAIAVPSVPKLKE